MKNFYAVFLLLSVFLLHGCISSFSPPPVKAVEKRVHMMMQAKMDGDWIKVYQFFDENYKSKVPKSVFENPSKAKFLAYTIEKIEIAPDGNEAQVVVKSDIEVNDYKIKGTLDNQKWIRENGTWVCAAKPTIGFSN